MGGNVFEGSAPILKENIKPTLREFFKDLKLVFPNCTEALKNITLVGSTGKAAESGDIDLALDRKYVKDLNNWSISKDEVISTLHDLSDHYRGSLDKKYLMQKAILKTIADKLDDESHSIKVDDRGLGNGSIFCQFPQYNETGEKIGKKVQIDLNVGNIDWITWTYQSSAQDRKAGLKGLHRTQLLHALFRAKGYVMNNGMGVREEGSKFYTVNTPDEAIALLNELYGFNLTIDDTKSFSVLHDFLKENFSEDEYNDVIAKYLHILDNTKDCNIPNELSNTWLDRQEELDLTGKHLPANSVLYPFRTED